MTGRADCIAIVGAGPAGLMAADYLAQRGHRIVIYDAMPSPARKFLMAGRGGLNLTHSEAFEDFLKRYPHMPHALETALRAFDPIKLRQWADALGAETFIGSSGRIFPKALKASPLLRAWLRRLDALGVTLHLTHRLTDISVDGTLTFAKNNAGIISIHPRATVLALGGASWPRLGSTGGWSAILMQRGVSVAPFEPSNMGFCTRWSPHFIERFAGAPLKNITIRHGNSLIAGEALITRDGLEGNAIYALSASLRNSIARGGHAAIQIDLKPALSVEQLAEKLQRTRRSKETQSHFLKRAAGLSPAAIGLLRESTGNLLPTDAMALGQAIKNAPVTFHAMQGLERAISSAGGITFDSITDDFMLKALPGIFVAGEMLDWEAPTGGYLLQATIATAVAAAHGVCHYLEAKQ